MSRSPTRAVPMVLVALVLLAGLWGGLARLGWSVPVGDGEVVGYHGVLMVLGALGSLIALERAVATGRPWGYVAPFASAGGAAALLAGLPVRVAQALFLLSGLVLLAVLVRILAMQPVLHAWVLALAGALWVGAVAVWALEGSVATAVPWLAGFLVVTIAAERLELARMRRLDALGRATFLVTLGALVGGLVLSLASFAGGVRLVGIALAWLGAWLATFDVARRTVRRHGLTRFMAAALLAGYAWLAVAGVLWIRYADVPGGGGRDAMLHALFLGFVISMVFAHAPVILPAVLGIDVAWRPAFYVHLVALHASLALRVIADLAVWPDVVRWMGLVNVLAVLLFLTNTAAARSRSRWSSRTVVKVGV